MCLLCFYLLNMDTLPLPGVSAVPPVWRCVPVELSHSLPNVDWHAPPEQIFELSVFYLFLSSLHLLEYWVLVNHTEKLNERNILVLQGVMWWTISWQGVVTSGSPHWLPVDISPSKHLVFCIPCILLRCQSLVCIWPAMQLNHRLLLKQRWGVSYGLLVSSLLSNFTLPYFFHFQTCSLLPQPTLTQDIYQLYHH